MTARYDDPVDSYDSRIDNYDGTSEGIENELRRASVFAHIETQRLVARVEAQHLYARV